MKTGYDFLTIGHITHDILNDRGRVSRFIGGAAFFSSFAVKRSGASLMVLSKLAKKDFGLLSQMREEGIEVIALPSTHTTSIENIFESEDVDRRKVNLLSQAEPFRLEEIPNVETKIFNLAGLFYGDIPPDMIGSLARKAAVGLDLQCMLRSSIGGSFSWSDWPEKRDYLPHITYLKADSLESRIITGNDDRREAAKMLQDWGAGEVLITHSSEVIVYDGTRVYSAPFNPSNLSGRTGRGDTCFASYMTRRLTHGIEESLSYAAALTSIKMEKPGPFLGTMEDVFRRMESLG
ncbi:MAG: carbohydrate kinase [Spirochaetaceae bacterium]|nr:MAG: carbohydrate kinase [Spirochaetaceae bacterium]